ncbi:MAG: hypothetical protein JXB04_12555 [Kiritimatiellae bacterium]|nr:hypothetical protein [Kiritimatiellia bacterium]
MKKRQKSRPAIRRGPAPVAAALREKTLAVRTGLSEAALETLARGTGTGDEDARGQDNDDLAGTWVKDRDFDRALRDMHNVDPEMWQ